MDYCSGFILLSHTIKKLVSPFTLLYYAVGKDTQTCILNSLLKSGKILQYTRSGSIEAFSGYIQTRRLEVKALISIQSLAV